MIIALTRLGSPVRDVDDAIQRLAYVYKQSVADGADLVVFPELVVPIQAVNGNAQGDLILTPSDLKHLAADAGPVAMLVGGSVEQNADAQKPPKKTAVFSLTDGAVEQLKFHDNQTQTMACPGQIIETMMLRNCWLGQGEVHEHYRPGVLSALNANVAFDFFDQSCIREGWQNQLIKVYWHLVQAGEDCVSNNGLICADAASVRRDISLSGDDYLIVDLDSKWPERLSCRSKAKQTGSSLIFGCATLLPLRVGPVEIAVEVQRSWRQFDSGMMFRDELADDEGMLFVYSRPTRASFYMRNTKSPLSCAYIDTAGVIQEIYDLSPFNCNPIRATSRNIQFVLETKQGWFARHDVKIGAAVVINRKTPGEIFFGISRRPVTP
jgi:uncharacterized membrane protein (UPF0127 family)